MSKVTVHECNVCHERITGDYNYYVRHRKEKHPDVVVKRRTPRDIPKLDGAVGILEQIKEHEKAIQKLLGDLDFEREQVQAKVLEYDKVASKYRVAGIPLRQHGES